VKRNSTNFLQQLLQTLALSSLQRKKIKTFLSSISIWIKNLRILDLFSLNIKYSFKACHRHSLSLSFSYTRTKTQMHIDIHRHTQIHKQMHTDTHRLTQSHKDTHTHKLVQATRAFGENTQMHLHTQYLSLSDPFIKHMHTHILSYPFNQTHTHMYT